MRKNSFHFSHNKGFSLLELIIVILILGILAYHSIPSFLVQESLCLYDLKAKLAKAHQGFLQEYTHKLISHQEIRVAPVIADLVRKDDPSCYFEYKKNTLIAHIGNETLPFTISPKDFSAKPKIYCAISKDLCRKFMGKKLKK